MGLRHGRLGPVQDVAEEVRVVEERSVGAAHVLGGIARDEKKMIRPVAPREIDVLPNLDETLGA